MKLETGTVLREMSREGEIINLKTGSDALTLKNHYSVKEFNSKFGSKMDFQSRKDNALNSYYQITDPDHG
jgi:hypothetical protein